MRVSKPLHEALCKEKTDLHKRERYIDRACECTAKLTYKFVALCWGIYVLKKVGWLPWELGLGGTTSIREQVVERALDVFPFK